MNLGARFRPRHSQWNGGNQRENYTIPSLASTSEEGTITSDDWQSIETMEKVDVRLYSDTGVVIKPVDGLATGEQSKQIFCNFKVVHCFLCIEDGRWLVGLLRR
jgi:hypothetical protein